ncbi:MAG: DciA family protein [Planctomycetota bacterium]
MDAIEQLRNRTKPRVRPEADTDSPARLGDAVRKLMEDWVSPRQARYESVADAWNELLPAGLSSHCRLSGVSGGRLKVVADSPSYMYELRLCSSRLVEELRQRCPRARIREIKVAVG